MKAQTTVAPCPASDALLEYALFCAAGESERIPLETRRKSSDTPADVETNRRVHPLAAHLLHCPDCFAAFQDVLSDANAARESLDDLARANRRPRCIAPLASVEAALFTIRNGALAAWNGLRGPRYAYRSTRTGTAKAVVESRIVPLQDGFVLLELANMEGGLRLTLEPGANFGAHVDISLYIDGEFVEKSTLGAKVHWNLDSFARGCYSVEFNQEKAFKFQIQG